MNIQEVPMKSYRITNDDQSFVDVFLTDIHDMSSIVMITDSNGDNVPFDQWENIETTLSEYLEENVY